MFSARSSARGRDKDVSIATHTSAPNYDCTQVDLDSKNFLFNQDLNSNCLYTSKSVIDILVQQTIARKTSSDLLTIQ